MKARSNKWGKQETIKTIHLWKTDTQQEMILRQRKAQVDEDWKRSNTQIESRTGFGQKHTQLLKTNVTILTWIQTVQNKKYNSGKTKINFNQENVKYNKYIFYRQWETNVG